MTVHYVFYTYIVEDCLGSDYVQVLWVCHVYQIYIFLDLADCQIQVFWVCHVWQTQVFLNLTDYQV
jgi:hypothetical protein